MRVLRLRLLVEAEHDAATQRWNGIHAGLLHLSLEAVDASSEHVRHVARVEPDRRRDGEHTRQVRGSIVTKIEAVGAVTKSAFVEDGAPHLGVRDLAEARSQNKVLHRGLALLYLDLLGSDVRKLPQNFQNRWIFAAATQLPLLDERGLPASTQPSKSISYLGSNRSRIKCVCPSPQGGQADALEGKAPVPSEEVAHASPSTTWIVEVSL